VRDSGRESQVSVDRLGLCVCDTVLYSISVIPDCTVFTGALVLILQKKEIRHTFETDVESLAVYLVAYHDIIIKRLHFATKKNCM